MLIDPASSILPNLMAIDSSNLVKLDRCLVIQSSSEKVIIPVKLLGKDREVESTSVLKPDNLILVRRIENPSIDYNIILGIILLSGDTLMKLHHKILDTFETFNNV